MNLKLTNQDSLAIFSKISNLVNDFNFCKNIIEKEENVPTFLGSSDWF